ncbi:MAG: EF-hand domain-containing protein [Oscillospiraceae bacterium]|nr:EF-hand domain-containing protein [Oscillospiraceae bacterium]
MRVWINSKKVGGEVSSNPTKVRRSVGVAIDGVIPEGKELFTGGVSWTKPIIDIGPYLVNGTNEIVIDYSSSMANVQLARGIITEQLHFVNTYHGVSKWGFKQVYLDLGPNQAVLIPYVEKVMRVFADIRSDEASAGLGAPASYTVSLNNATGAGVVTLSFTANSRYLDLTSATALNGFSILDPLSWEYVGGQLWKGTVELYYPGFVQNNDPLDVLRISGVALDLLGDTTVTLTDISVSGDMSGYSGVLPSVITTAEAVTSIVTKTVFSKYDLNHDGRIDELDLAIVVFYYLANDLEADWIAVKFDIASAKDCDVAHNGRIDLADMIEVIVNYCDSY